MSAFFDEGSKQRKRYSSLPAVLVRPMWSILSQSYHIDTLSRFYHRDKFWLAVILYDILHSPHEDFHQKQSVIALHVYVSVQGIQNINPHKMSIYIQRQPQHRKKCWCFKHRQILTSLPYLTKFNFFSDAVVCLHYYSKYWYTLWWKAFPCTIVNTVSLRNYFFMAWRNNMPPIGIHTFGEIGNWISTIKYIRNETK